MVREICLCFNQLVWQTMFMVEWIGVFVATEPFFFRLNASPVDIEKKPPTSSTKQTKMSIHGREHYPNGVKACRRTVYSRSENENRLHFIVLVVRRSILITSFSCSWSPTKQCIGWMMQMQLYVWQKYLGISLFFLFTFVFSFIQMCSMWKGFLSLDFSCNVHRRRTTICGSLQIYSPSLSSTLAVLSKCPGIFSPQLLFV